MPFRLLLKYTSKFPRLYQHDFGQIAKCHGDYLSRQYTDWYWEW